MKRRRAISAYGWIILGCLLTALAFNFFFIPNQIAPGGVSGIGTVVFYRFGVPVGVTMLLLNIPLFLLGLKQMGGGFGIRTLFATIVLSLMIDFIKVPPLTQDLMLASIYGGVLMGTGLGIIFRMNATTGGTDLFARLVHRRLPFISVGWVLFIIDFFVVFSAGIVFGPTEALYAVVALAVSAKIIDLVQEGLNTAKAVIVISDAAPAISDRILSDMDRGVTLLHGQGAYTRREKEVILCVVSRMQIIRLKGIIQEIDPQAFVLVADVREVMGEGF